MGKSMKGNKVQTGLRLNEPLYYKVKALSELEQRSLNNLVEYALQKYVREYEAVNGSIRNSYEQPNHTF